MSQSDPHTHGKSKYLFINKRAENIGCNGKTEAHAIGSHLANYKRREKRRRNMVLKFPSLVNKTWPQVTIPFTSNVPRLRAHGPHKLLPNRSKPTHISKPPASLDRMLDTASRTQSIIRKELKLAKSTNLRPVQAAGNQPALPETRQLVSASLSQQEYPSPTNLVGNGNSDPFSAAALPLTAHHHCLIRFCEYRFRIFICSSEQSTLSVGKLSRAWQDEIRAAIANKTQLHAMFSSALIHQSQTMHSSTDQSLAISRALYHKIACLASLQTLLSSSIGEYELLKTVYMAALMHLNAGEIGESDIHLRAMAILVNRLGGINSLDQILALRIVLFDTLSKSLTQQTPVFKLRDWDPGSLLEQSFATNKRLKSKIKEWQETKACGPGSAQPQVVMSSLTHRYLQSHREIIFAKQLAQHLVNQDPGLGHLVNTSNPSDQPSEIDIDLVDAIERWVLVRRYAVIAVRLEMDNKPMDDTPATGSTPDPPSYHLHGMIDFEVDRCLVLALDFCQRLIFVSRWNRFATYIPFQQLRESLARVLKTMRKTSSFTRAEALLYTFFIGAAAEDWAQDLAANWRSGMGLSHWWFSEHFTAVRVAIGVSGYEHTKALLSQFLYDEVIFDKPLRRLLKQYET